MVCLEEDIMVANVISGNDQRLSSWKTDAAAGYNLVCMSGQWGENIRTEQYKDVTVKIGETGKNWASGDGVRGAWQEQTEESRNEDGLQDENNK